MAEFTVNTRDLTNSSFSWEALVKKFDSEGKIKNYEVIDGNLITPIEIEYKLQIYKVANLNSAGISLLNASNNMIIISEKTEEEFYKSIESNNELLTSYLEWFEARDYKSSAFPEDEQRKDKEMFFSSATEIQKIRPFITDHIELEDAYKPNDWIVIEQNSLDFSKIVDIMDNHPNKQSIIDSISEREEEMRRLIIENQKRDRETVRRNNFETWKILNEKFGNGEFDDYMIEPRV